MKLSEIKKSVTVALMTGIAASSEAKNVEESDVFTEDIQRQCQVVGDYLATKFLHECMNEAEKCLQDNESFDALMKDFNKIGARFSTNIEEEN